jgi:hypothetical protein
MLPTRIGSKTVVRCSGGLSSGGIGKTNKTNEIKNGAARVVPRRPTPPRSGPIGR